MEVSGINPPLMVWPRPVNQVVKEVPIVQLVVGRDDHPEDLWVLARGMIDAGRMEKSWMPNYDVSCFAREFDGNDLVYGGISGDRIPFCLVVAD